MEVRMTKNTITINGVPVYVDSSAVIELLSGKKETPLMAEYAWLWYETSKKKLCSRTRITYQWLITKHIEPFFKDLRVSDVNVSVMQRFYDEKSSLSRSTIRQCRIILHQVFNAAIKNKLIDTNPTESVRLTYSDRAQERRALMQEDVRDAIRQLPRLKGNNLLLPL